MNGWMKKKNKQEEKFQRFYRRFSIQPRQISFSLRAHALPTLFTAEKKEMETNKLSSEKEGGRARRKEKKRRNEMENTMKNDVKSREKEQKKNTKIKRVERESKEYKNWRR